MFRLTLTSLAAAKVRLALTAVSVVLGVSFVVASFVLSDGLRRSFDDLSAAIARGTDLTVRSPDDLGGRQPLDDDLVAVIAATPGVAAVAPQLETEGVTPLDDTGQPIGRQGPPTLGFAWSDNETLSSMSLVEGRAPQQGAEFTLEQGAAEEAGFVIGRSYDIITPTGRRTAELVGITEFEGGATLGAVLTHYPLETAQEWFGLPGQVREVAVDVAEGTSVAGTAAAIAERVGNLDVIDERTLAAQTADGYAPLLDLFGAVLLGFAVVSLFVSSFIIANTFSVVVTQRVRELAVLRAIGATTVQVRAMVLGEAALVGLVSSLAGIAGGVGLSVGLRGLFSAVGIGLPDADVILAPRTIVAALALGMGVTVVAALRPAAWAAATAPVAAIRIDAVTAPPRQRVLVGIVLLVMAVGGAVLSRLVELDGAATGVVVAASCLAGVVGLLSVAPALARPFTAVVGAPLAALGGTTGRLARANAGRTPQRTAATAGALMIGLGLVSATLVIGQSMKSHIADVAQRGIRADVVVTQDGGEGGIASAVADRLAADPRIAAVTPLRSGEIRVAGVVREVQGAELSVLEELFAVGVVEGALRRGSDAMALHVDAAADLGVGVGDIVSAEVATGGSRTFTVIALYDDDAIVGRTLVDLAAWDAISAERTDTMVAASLADGVGPAEGRALRNDLADVYPNLRVVDGAGFADLLAGQVDQLLAAVNLLLVLALVIALLGIANTLALSVFERTRELGLLRAVGMSRRSVRGLVRGEALLIAAFGAALGVVLGVGMGTTVVGVLPARLAGAVVVPGAALATVVLVAVAASLLAARSPARRAARLDVLAAVASSIRRRRGSGRSCARCGEYRQAVA